MYSRDLDAAGVFLQGPLAFGHRRLSILDLAASLQQSMIDNDLGLGVIFNGCIYNFKELRAELESKGYKSFSRGDTEVILKACHGWGANCVRKFKGMFAFAVWERDKASVPFLEHCVMELAARVPANLKVTNCGKHILKQATRKLLPTDVIDRPKGYFPVLSLRYLRGPFLAYVRDILTSSEARTRGLYNSEFTNYMLQWSEAEMSPKGHSRLWQATLLEA